MSPTLYIRISDTDLCFARYEAGREPVFDFSRYRARHHASLTMNLREAKNQESILQAPIERVEALVVDAVTVVPPALELCRAGASRQERCKSVSHELFRQNRSQRLLYRTWPLRLQHHRRPGPTRILHKKSNRILYRLTTWLFCNSWYNKYIKKRKCEVNKMSMVEKKKSWKLA